MIRSTIAAATIAAFALASPAAAQDYYVSFGGGYHGGHSLGFSGHRHSSWHQPHYGYGYSNYGHAGHGHSVYGRQHYGGSNYSPFSYGHAHGYNGNYGHGGHSGHGFGGHVRHGHHH